MADTVVKWDQGRRTEFPIHNLDEGFMRKFVMKDFMIFSLIYLCPPLANILNKFADYPLKFVSKKWIVSNSILSIIALLTLILPWLLPQATTVTPFERRGAIFAFFLRCILTACVESLNIESDSVKSLHLERFPIQILEDPSNTKLTAKEFYLSIMDLSKFTTEINFKTLIKRKMGLVSGLLISVGLIAIPCFLRYVRGINIFGKSIYESFCIILSAIVIFGVSFLLINVFFIGFALYRSMRSSMRRLKNGTIGAWEAHVYKENLRNEVGEGPINLKNVPAIKLDVTIPINLRAWLNVHEALARRKDDVAARLLELGTTLGVFFFVLLIFLIVLESFSTDYDGMSKLEIIDDITSLDHSSIYVFTFLVFILGASIGVLSLVGNEYNYSAKQMQMNHLYAIQLESTLDYYSGNSNLSDAEISKLKNSIHLLESVHHHLKNHVKDLGILGISYSKLFWGISGVVSSILTRQLFHMF